MEATHDSLVARMRFRHLRLLVELQQAGTLGRAAERLHLSQPAMSKALKEVEAAFGFALFQRGSRGLTPTPRGSVVVQGAALLLAELRHVVDTADASVATPTAVLRLGAPPAVAAGGALPGVLARLMAARRAGRLVVQLREDAAPRLFDALVAGELDALLTSYNQAAFAARRPVKLEYERCADHSYVVIAPAGHRLAAARRLGWPDLAGEPWIMAGAALLSRQAVESQFLRAGTAVPAPCVVSDSPATTVQLVAAGVGIAAVPAAMARADEAIGRVVKLAVAMTPRRVPAALVYRAASRGSDALQQLRRALSGA